jgi:hypothetical protein
VRAADLAVLYLLVGTGCLLFVLVRRRRLAGRGARLRTGDGLLEPLLAFACWPLYAPFLPAPRPGQLERGPSGLLTGPAAARLLEQRLAAAGGRIAEIDRLLALPEFEEAGAQERLATFSARGGERGAAAARSRLQNIERLQRLRARSAREVEELRELLGQLRVQTEVVRLSGPGGGASPVLAADLAPELDGERELLCRLEALDALLGEESPQPGQADAAATGGTCAPRREAV